MRRKIVVVVSITVFLAFYAGAALNSNARTAQFGAVGGLVGIASGFGLAPGAIVGAVIGETGGKVALR